MVSQATQIPPPPADDWRVMIVEDEQSSRHALSLLLDACGYRTQAFRSAEEAIASIDAARAPQIALVDRDLPGMGGLDLISRLQRLSPTLQPVLITASARDTLPQSLEDESIVYLRKPIHFLSLLELLGRLQTHA